jgi:hypothetical protein
MYNVPQRCELIGDMVVRGARGVLAGRCATVLILATLFAVPVAKGAQPGSSAGPRAFTAVFPGVHIVRCLLEERRVVVRSSGKLIVLHPGDTLPAAGLKFRAADGQRLVFETVGGALTSSGARIPNAIVIISSPGKGALVVRVVRRTPPEGARPPLILRAGTRKGIVSAVSAKRGGIEAVRSPAHHN